MSISSQPRAGDVRALFGAIGLGSGMGLAIGAAYLLGGFDRVSGVRMAPPAAPAMESSVATINQPAPHRIVPAPAATVQATVAGAASAQAKAPHADISTAMTSLRNRFHFTAAAIAARPFRLAGSADDADLNCLTEVVYYEARGEPEAGQKAVAQVVLNRVRHPAFPKTICGVVHQRSEAGCQFTFACKSLASQPIDNQAWRRSRKVAAGALHGSVMAGVGEATHFQTVRSGAFAGLLKVAQIGAHVFYRFSGRAGADAMFHQAPAPSHSVLTAAADKAPASAGRIVVASLGPTTAQVSYTPSSAIAAPQVERAAASSAAAVPTPPAKAAPASATPITTAPVADKASVVAPAKSVPAAERS